MGRKRKKRFITYSPKITEYIPTTDKNQIFPVIMRLDEYEAIKLADYFQMEHAEASKIMGISRSTFTRLIEKARKKLSTALIEGKKIVIEGGEVQPIYKLYICKECGTTYIVEQNSEIKECKWCKCNKFETKK